MKPLTAPATVSLDPGSHVQFQISLLRLLSEQTEEDKLGARDIVQADASGTTSAQIMELQQLQQPRAKAVLKARR